MDSNTHINDKMNFQMNDLNTQIKTEIPWLEEHTSQNIYINKMTKKYTWFRARQVI